MCQVLGLAERTYYAAKARAPSARALSDEAAKVEIRRVWEANYRAYGAKRVWLALRSRGPRNSARCTVERLMTEMGIAGVQRGRRPPHHHPRHRCRRGRPDLVDRRFVAERPDELWVTDITYVSTWEGWLYVAFVLDVHSRVIVGWQIAPHLRTELVLDAIEMAIWRRDTSGGLTCHSDAGCQFTSYRYTQRLADAGIAASIGSVGDSYDCEDPCRRVVLGSARLSTVVVSGGLTLVMTDLVSLR